MTNNKQSSIMWLYEKMLVNYGRITIEEFEQAKAMHKEEIGDAYFLGYGDHQTLDWHDLDEHYNETFNQ